MVNPKRGRLHSDAPRKKSLNSEARRRQLVQINTENQALLKRLQDKKASIGIKQFKKERETIEKRLKNICEYPYQLGMNSGLKKRKTSVELGALSVTDSSF